MTYWTIYIYFELEQSHDEGQFSITLLSVVIAL